MVGNRERCCSDSAALPVTPGDAAEAAEKREVSNVGDGGDGSTGVGIGADSIGGGGGSRSRSRFASKFRGGKLLPSSMSWPTSLTIAKKGGTGAGAGSEGVGDGLSGAGGVLERRATMPDILKEQQAGLVWISPLFRHRRKASRNSRAMETAVTGAVTTAAEAAATAAAPGSAGEGDSEGDGVSTPLSETSARQQQRDEGVVPTHASGNDAEAASGIQEFNNG